MDCFSRPQALLDLRPAKDRTTELPVDSGLGPHDEACMGGIWAETRDEHGTHRFT